MCVGVVLYVPERPAFDEPLLEEKLVVSTLGEADDRPLSTQSALRRLIRGQAWSHSQELSSRCHPACMSPRPQLHTEAIRSVRKHVQGHLLNMTAFSPRPLSAVVVSNL